MRRFFAPLLTLGLLAGCGGDSPSEPTGSIPFTTLSDSKVPGFFSPPIQTVVRDEATWRQLWSDLWGDLEPARPEVDFSRDIVVLVTGSVPCFGRAVVEEIVHTGDAIVVRYSDAAPSICLCIQAQLAFHAVRLPRILGEARFEARQAPALCPA